MVQSPPLHLFVQVAPDSHVIVQNPPVQTFVAMEPPLVVNEQWSFAHS